MDKNNKIEIWPIVKLGEYCHKPEYGLTTSATNIPSAPKFLRITDIQDAGVNWDDVPYCESIENLRESQKLLPGDVVIARIGATTGKAHVIRQCPDAVFASYLIRLRTKPELLPEFLGVYLQTEDYWKQIDQNKGGRLKGGVNIPILQNLTLPLPSLSVQQAITHALRAVQEAREARRKELQLERERKAALMQYLFTQGTRGEACKLTEIGEMPESWQLRKIEDLVEMKYGYQTSIPSTPPLNGIEIISTAEIQNDGILNLSKIRTVSIEERLIANYVIAREDVLFNWRNSQEHVGKAAIVTFQPDHPIIYASFIIRLRTLDGLDAYFLHNQLTYLRRQGLFFKLSRRAVNQANFNANELGGLFLALPTQQEQQEINCTLGKCDNKIAALEKESTLLDELFRAMLEELMTGRLSTLPLIED